MALKINTKVTTDEGFEVSDALAYLNIFILAPESNWVNISYFKSEQDWKDGKQPLNVSELPSNVQTELTSEEFWSNSLALTIHNKCLAKIEEVTGENTVEVKQ
jgi:predicted nucleotidyltransferase